MVTGPIPQINQALNPTAPPPVAPSPPSPAAPIAPVQTGFTPLPQSGQTDGLNQTNGTDSVLISENAIQAQTAPPPPAGADQVSTLNPGPPPGTPPFPGIIPSAAQASQTGFIPSEDQTFIQAAPVSPIQDLAAGQSLDVTA
ncbi:MAG: hypothetical protein P9L94_14810 [Candidatus Hinthialibacter antarcticus]|nr:hypothetical protein [Candidatus Hinthialibacter antarcticus]